MSPPPRLNELPPPPPNPPREEMVPTSQLNKEIFPAVPPILVVNPPASPPSDVIELAATL